jgi:hypothetical protein
VTAGADAGDEQVASGSTHRRTAASTSRRTSRAERRLVDSLGSIWVEPGGDGCSCGCWDRSMWWWTACRGR